MLQSAFWLKRLIETEKGDKSVKNIRVEILRDFDAIGVKIGQLSCTLSEEGDIRLSGSVRVEQCLDEYVLHIKANICDKENILYVLEGTGISFEYTKFDGFSIYYTNLGRFFGLDNLDHLDVYPKAVKRRFP